MSDMIRLGGANGTQLHRKGCQLSHSHSQRFIDLHYYERTELWLMLPFAAKIKLNSYPIGPIFDHNALWYQ